MSQCSSQYNEIKDVDGLNLFGMLPITKRLTLQVPKFLSLFLYEILNSNFFQVCQSVVMMVITIFQFKHLAK